MTLSTLTYAANRPGVPVDLDRLVASRLLVQANSGGGKSRAIRQLLEETHGRIQHLVIDPEGEFATLRERYDYVLAAPKEGDVLATPKTARLLCRRLMELGASAVLDIYDLALHDRREFVKLFLTELMALPRPLWRPVIVVIDEAHVFAPQVGESQALEMVTALCTQGRKRGFCPVLATQRIAKLHKDAAAELLNKLIGRTGLDVDVKRAGDELGFDKDQRGTLKSLEPGEFFAYGPAISNSVQRVRTGEVRTTHPEAGRVSTAPPPAPERVQKVLAQLSDLAQKAEEEARTVADLERRNRELTAQVRRLEKGAPGPVQTKPVVDQAAIDRAVALALAKHDREVRVVFDRRGRVIRQVATLLEKTGAAIAQGALDLRQVVELPTPSTNGHGPSVPESRSIAPSTPRLVSPGRPAVPRERRAVPDGADSSLPRGERAILTAAAQYPDGATREQLTILTGYKRSTRDAYVQRLGEKSFLTADRSGLVVATDDGVAALGDDFEPLPTGAALREYWLDRLPEGEGRILAALLEAYPGSVDRDTLTEATEYKRSTRDAYLQRLGTRRLVTTDRAGVRAADTLFED